MQIQEIDAQNRDNRQYLANVSEAISKTARPIHVFGNRKVAEVLTTRGVHSIYADVPAVLTGSPNENWNTQFLESFGNPRAVYLFDDARKLKKALPNAIEVLHPPLDGLSEHELVETVCDCLTWSQESNGEYPMHVWSNTLYGAFAEACGHANVIPPEFLVEAVKTITGAICGHRLKLRGTKQDGRFYTALIGPAGTGKSTAVAWALSLFPDNLVSSFGEAAFKNVGAFRCEFGSGVGMVETFSKHSRILQTYDELAGLVEKFRIQGSGGNFLSAMNELYDGNRVSPNITKGRSEIVQTEVFNSLLGCCTPEKWLEIFARTDAAETGFLSRLNIVANLSTDAVAFLREPDLAKLSEKLAAKIAALENAPVEFLMTPEAEKLLHRWYSEFVKYLPASSEEKSRIQAFALRNGLHLAWLMQHDSEGCWYADSISPIFSDESIGTELTLDDERVLVLDEYVAQRAISLANYQLQMRRRFRPLVGENTGAIVEEAIRRKLTERGTAMSSRELYRAINAHRYGSWIFNSTLQAMQIAGEVEITPHGRQTRSVALL